MVTSPYICYVLIHPETYEPRYVGKSSSMFRRARAMHTAKCGSWMKSLKKKGLEPIVRVLGFYDDHSECLEDEIFYIKKFREMGFDLLNIMDGGEGVTPGYKQPPEVVEKRAAALRGKKRDPAIGKKISASLSGKRNVAILCAGCGNEFTVLRSRAHRKFCKQACLFEWMKGKPRDRRWN